MTPLRSALVVASVIFAVAAGALAQSASPSRYPAVTRRLANGLRVVVSPQHDTSRIAVWVRYAAGFRDDPSDYHGLAHVLEHMMFQRTSHLSEDEFAELLEHAGATDINATTSADHTDYHEVLPAEQLPLALWLESDRMAFLLGALDTAAIDAQRRVVLNEDALHQGPDALANRALAAALYPVGHPYRLLQEDASDVRAIGVNEVSWFFEHHYAPHAATLVITGDVDLDATMAMVDQYFGVLRDRASDARATSAPPVDVSPRRSVTVLAPRTFASMRIVWSTPRFFAPGDAELDVLSTLLTANDDASLRSMLVRSEQASAVDAAEESQDLSSEFAIDVDLNHAIDGGTVLQEVDRHLAAIRAGQIDDNALVDWRRTWVRHVHSREEDVLARAANLAQYASVFDDADAFGRDAARYGAVTAASLQSAVAQLRDDRRVVEWIQPDLRVPSAGRLVPDREGAGRVQQAR